MEKTKFWVQRQSKVLIDRVPEGRISSGVSGGGFGEEADVGDGGRGGGWGRICVCGSTELRDDDDDNVEAWN